MNPSVSRVASIFAAATLLTLLNSVKPLYVDDAVYYRYAAQISRHPFDPYGFEVYWSQQMPEPAMHVLVPPLVPYWLAAGIRLFGDRPVWWKLWVFPFSLLFAVSLDALFRRFAGGLETPLLWMTILSPVFLPSLNLMLDIPALALGLLALTQFQRAADRGSWGLSALSGWIAGLALLTKYTALVIPAALLGYGWVFRRIRLASLAAALALLVFAAWELALGYAYGESHFLYHLQIWGIGGLAPSSRKELHLLQPLVGILGGVAPVLALLGLAAMEGRRRHLILAAAVTVAGYALIAVAPELRLPTGKSSLNNLVFGVLGLGVCGVLAAVAWRVWRLSKGRAWARNGPGQSGTGRFLVLWLGLELAGYLALSPYPAVRRVMGVVVSATALVGHLASRTASPWMRRHLVPWVVAGGMLLGLVYAGVDLLEAKADKEIVDRAARYIRERDPRASIWYVGLWGVQFYADRAGMKPTIPGVSRLRRGDWLVVPGDRVLQQRIEIDADRARLMDSISVEDVVPVSTKFRYYGGRTPMEHLSGPRASVRIYLLTADFTPLHE